MNGGANSRKRSTQGQSSSEQRRVTAGDVARLAGVSRSAVSRAFTPGAYVSPDKRTRIQDVSAQLGYRPNALAASLHAGTSNLVGIVTGDLANHYDGEVVGKLVERLNQIGKWPVVVGGASEKIRESEILDVLAFPLAALVVRGGSVDESIALQCSKLNVPLIVSGRVLELKGVDSVCCDNAAGAELAVRQFISGGRQNIGYIGGPLELTSEQERHEGFCAALEEAGSAPSSETWADFSFQGGYDAAIEILSSESRPDALFCCNDAMALGAYCASTIELGLSVPTDLGIIGFDDIEMAAWPCFQLTTVRNSIDQTVQTIMRLIENRFENPHRESEIVRLQPLLIERLTH